MDHIIAIMYVNVIKPTINTPVHVQITIPKVNRKHNDTCPNHNLKKQTTNKPFQVQIIMFKSQSQKSVTKIPVPVQITIPKVNPNIPIHVQITIPK